ncbi:hypothetical protein OSB04_028582 [Centaurea solstitialis]|uniref:GDSL esterase/lipase n=1 Tax=Centaurea solstitialis TaxID=347529 RepID=A0AA38WBB5_9ASTR|nr:hypothetical protein OSB04_028582 [Centaurea solstitialis]
MGRTKRDDRARLEVIDKGCCGTGNIEVIFLCNKLSSTCYDDSKYLFWDSVHLSQEGNKIFINHILQDLVNKPTTPLDQLCGHHTRIVTIPAYSLHLILHHTCGVIGYYTTPVVSFDITPHLWCHLPQHLTCGVICFNTTPVVSSTSTPHLWCHLS